MASTPVCRGGFVENAWRKDLCSNCFRTREEHNTNSPTNVISSTIISPTIVISPDQINTSSFQQQSWSSNHSTAPPIHIKAPPPSSLSSSSSPIYGLPPAPQSKVLFTTTNSKYQLPPVGMNTHVGQVNGLRKSTLVGRSANLPSPINYEDRLSSGRSYGGSIQNVNNIITSSGGINVTVNGTSNSTIKKYIQQHPPQAAIRTSIPASNPKILGNNCGVSVGRSSSYSQLNTIGRISCSSSIGGRTQQQQQHQQQRRHQLPPPTTAPPPPTLNYSISHPNTNTTIIQNHHHSSSLQSTRNIGHNTINNRSNTNNIHSNNNNKRVVMNDQTDSHMVHHHIQILKGMSKGILKKEGQNRKMSVSFPQEVCAVIGFGGESRGSSEDESEEETPSDPLDSSPISEILEKSATSPLEKELNKVTVKNTNFNSIKTNLLGHTSIEIGPITGGMGGKSKPLVSIGTFENRNQSNRILRKEEPKIIKTKTIPLSRPKVKENDKPKLNEFSRNSTTNGFKGNNNGEEEIETPKETILFPILPGIVHIQSSITTKEEDTFHNINNINNNNSITFNNYIQEQIPLPDYSSSESEGSEKYTSLTHDSLEPPPRIIKSELKLELNQEIIHDEYEDDSLDSGLDVKQIQINSSESDTEKYGSNSDSGNENDFILEKKNRIGLFVQTEQTPQIFNVIGSKLSPDSVISSEMSSTSPTQSSGSNESIPIKIQQEHHHQLNNSTIPPLLKRLAPLPPIIPPPVPPVPQSTSSSYSREDLYDDVHALTGQLQDPSNSTFETEESLYDDCATVLSQVGSPNDHSKGSYDFTQSVINNDPEFSERVPLKQHEEIEFLGIRRIDSESFLKEQSPPLMSPTYHKSQLSPSSSKGTIGKNKSRGGSESPKQKRRVVNQFFSTIGKRAGAAFSRSSSNQPSPIGFDLTPNGQSATTPYKRSMSQDEVSMARTQELYATLTPTSFKMRGLAPVLGKLSKLELKDESGDKIKKHKFSNSIRKFLGFGNSEIDSERSSKSPPRITESPPRGTMQKEAPPYSAPPPVIRPPPPPPRFHSLDTLPPKSGTMSAKPARPPPPRMNQVAPSFVSVFSASEDTEEDLISPGYHPPNKPRRRASIREESHGDGGAYTANYLETTYNHITSLNFETLQLIASQEPAKIQRASNQLLKLNKNPLRWSQFFVTDVEPVAYGHGFAFFSAFWEDEPCNLLLQESLSSGIPPLEFHCIEISASFEDIVQSQFIPWEPSDYIQTPNGVKVFISVLAACTIQKLPYYINNMSISPSRKFYALLQAMDFWGNEEMKDLVVFHKIPSEDETPEPVLTKSKSSPSPNFGLVYVVSCRIKYGGNNSFKENFQREIEGLLLNGFVLTSNDMDILQRRIRGSFSIEELQAQLRLFLQLKLFGPQSGDLDKILRYRSDRQVIQWMDKERAYCMNDALKRSLERNSEPISPLRKSFVEFLMISDNCAKTILDFIVDLFPADT